MFRYKITNVAEILEVPASKLRYWRQNIPGAWDRREDQRLVWPELLSLAVIARFSEQARLETAVFAGCFETLVNLLCGYHPIDLFDQRLLFNPNQGLFEIVSVEENVYEKLASGDWVVSPLGEIVRQIFDCLFSTELGDEEKSHSVASSPETEKLKPAA
ncbi:hypothetical protein [Wenzhouxiangella limi]|uniref:Uncharacterized protein n=1 Tax=Wenzhouxiangella limi TaxID=2707351 RepID=A0A845UW49_9GAMM|nr:hypothetical protein [Wenzhouxiangella limi]NDY94754.1 hypothetical protein [Wenzhouxiangella limi]